MSVKGVVVDPTSGAPLVVLQDGQGQKLLPIAIGTNEARSISMEMAQVTPIRPMTYDLITKILAQLDAKVSRVVINDVKDSIVYALLYLKLTKGELVIDARPSDAINIALRHKAHIFVTKKVRETMVIDVLPKEKERERLTL
jgi:bifunctional DNase/RNase